MKIAIKIDEEHLKDIISNYLDDEVLNTKVDKDKISIIMSVGGIEVNYNDNILI